MKKTKKKYIFIEGILGILIIGCIGLLIAWKIKDNKMLIPDYASGTIDVNAIKEDTSNVKKDYNAGSGSVNLKFSNKVLINKSEKTAKMYFKNPGTSTENIVVYLIIRQNNKEIVLGKTEMIPAGYAIYSMTLDDISMLSVGGYKGLLKTVYYNEKTNAKEMVDSEIKVEIEVE